MLGSSRRSCHGQRRWECCLQPQEHASEGRAPLDEVLDGGARAGPDHERAEDVCRGEQRRSHARVHRLLACRLQRQIRLVRV